MIAVQVAQGVPQQLLGRLLSSRAKERHDNEEGRKNLKKDRSIEGGREREREREDEKPKKNVRQKNQVSVSSREVWWLSSWHPLCLLPGHI